MPLQERRRGTGVSPERRTKFAGNGPAAVEFLGRMTFGDGDPEGIIRARRMPR
jgi:hypothetical protein